MSVLEQHESAGKVRVVEIENYDADLLGAPFKVVLLNGVSQLIMPDGEVKHRISNLNGLIRAVVRARAHHPRKLSGADITFIRKVLGLKAKSIAKMIDVSPEHLSRCEAGTKVLSGSSEKIFRMIAFAGTFCNDAEATLNAKPSSSPLKRVDEASLKRIMHPFLEMDIVSVFDAEEELELEFIHGHRVEPGIEPDEPVNDDNGEWTTDEHRLAA